MQTFVVPVINPKLSDVIQSFLFFKKSASDFFAYTTFPNTNLCLAIYKNNQVQYKHNSVFNHCNIHPGINKRISRIYGFHKQPFSVSIEGEMDQICILFKPGGLRAFTKLPFDYLMDSDHAFEDLMLSGSDGASSSGDSSTSERLFEIDDVGQRAIFLESILLKRVLPGTLNPLAVATVRLMNEHKGNATIDSIARSLHVDPSTVYRLFLANVGQSPKEFSRTLRFRTALTAMKSRDFKNFTELAYLSEYYDQADSIKHIKQLTGFTPKRLQQNLRVEQDELLWITRNQQIA